MIAAHRQMQERFAASFDSDHQSFLQPRGYHNHLIFLALCFIQVSTHFTYRLDTE